MSSKRLAKYLLLVQGDELLLESLYYLQVTYTSVVLQANGCSLLYAINLNVGETA